MVDGARLESVWALTRPVGSNPTLSASASQSVPFYCRQVHDVSIEPTKLCMRAAGARGSNPTLSASFLEYIFDEGAERRNSPHVFGVLLRTLWLVNMNCTGRKMR